MDFPMQFSGGKGPKAALSRIMGRLVCGRCPEI